MHPNDDPDSITRNNNNGADSNRLEKMLQGISIETIEAEAIMYLAIYYHENDDFDSAAMYVHYIYRSIRRLILVQHLNNSLLYLTQYTLKRFCSRLLDYPGPEREQAKGMLREMRSRKSKSTTRSVSTWMNSSRNSQPTKN